MPVRVRYVTDPACPASWSAEPEVRSLMVEFGGDLEWSWVMAGLAREIDSPEAHAAAWFEEAGKSAMPFDPRIWADGPIRSTYPACMAVKAASDQGPHAADVYLRALREGLMCMRRKLDTTEAFVEEARRVGLDSERFRLDLGSHATVEAFGADLEEARAGGRAIPRATFVGGDGRKTGPAGPGELRDAALAAGAIPSPEPRPTVAEALARFGRLGDPEVEAVCGLPEPRAQAELWALALDWRARPHRALTGRLWEAA